MKIYQMTNHSRSQMMGYVLVTKKKHVIVIDGGCADDSEDIRRILAAENTRVSMWMLTHPHYDHHDVLIEIMKNSGNIAVAGIYHSYLPDGWGANEPKYHQNIIDINACLAKSAWPVHDIKCDDQLGFDGVVIDVLGVSNPDITVNAFNNSSCVFKITEGGFSFLVLGDLGVEGGRRLMEKHDNSRILSCNAVQMAHHGQNGVEKDVYQSIAPEYAFWPTPDWLWDNTSDPDKPGTGPWKTLEVCSWMDELHTVNITSLNHTVVFDSGTGATQEF